MSITNTILTVTRRTKNGFTVGEIFDRVVGEFGKRLEMPPMYSSVRARVYELASSGKLTQNSTRKDSASGRTAATFRRYNS